MSSRSENLLDVVYVLHAFLALITLFGEGSLFGGHNSLVSFSQSEAAQVRTQLSLTIGAIVLLPLIAYVTVKEWKQYQLLLLAVAFVTVNVVGGVWPSVLYLAASLFLLNKHSSKDKK